MIIDHERKLYILDKSHEEIYNIFPLLREIKERTAQITGVHLICEKCGELSGTGYIDIYSNNIAFVPNFGDAGSIPVNFKHGKVYIPYCDTCVDAAIANKINKDWETHYNESSLTPQIIVSATDVGYRYKSNVKGRLNAI